MIAARTERDAPRMVQDGTIWPQPRERMVSAKYIIARIAEDIQALSREIEAVTFKDIQELGWKQSQIAAYVQKAVDALPPSWRGA